MLRQAPTQWKPPLSSLHDVSDDTDHPFLCLKVQNLYQITFAVAKTRNFYFPNDPNVILDFLAFLVGVMTLK